MATDSLLPSVVPPAAQQMEEGFDVDSLLMSSDLLTTTGGGDNDDLLAGLLDGADTSFINDLFNVPVDLSSTSPAGSGASGLAGSSSPDSNYNSMMGVPSFDNWTTNTNDQTSSSPHSASEEGQHSPDLGYANINCSPTQLASSSGWFPLDSQTTVSRDIHIDVELGEELVTSSSSERKMGSVVITGEERSQLLSEGINLPVDMPLTKAEEKHLKRIRRKIKNKQSAADSRKRKKEYVDGLERRVEKCTEMNNSLIKKVKLLESENRSLIQQLKKLQAFVGQYNPTKAQAGTFMMIMILSFSLLVVPQVYKPHNIRSSLSHSRSLLDVSADEFGNMLKSSDSGFVGVVKDKTPMLPPPWKYQSPAIRPFNTSATG